MNQPVRPLFGELAIRAGWLGQEHVDWALAVQAERKKHGVHLYIGSILVKQQYISVEQALQILRHQRVQIMLDPQTQHHYNVHNFDSHQQYQSPESTGILQPVSHPQSLNVRGDIGLRQVQSAQAQAAPHQQGGGAWAEEEAVGGQTIWEDDPGGLTDDADSGSEPIFAELAGEEKESANDEVDWYGQTILDDGSLAAQLKAAAAAESTGVAPEPVEPSGAEAVPLEDLELDPQPTAVPSVRAKPGTVAFLALPHGTVGEQAYRAITDTCAAKGIATIRMDDVADTAAIWKGIERFISGASLIIADLTGEPKPTPHVGHEVKHAVRHRKPLVVLSSTPQATTKVISKVGLAPEQVVAYSGPQQLPQALDPALSQALQNHNLAG